MKELGDIITNYDFRGKKLLIADSDFSSVRYAVEVLRKTGAEVISTNNGNDAVKAISEENIDMAFVNIWLPSKNGYDVASEIRNLKNKKSKIPLIACLTSPGSEDTEQCMASGYNDFLRKPIYPQQFVDMLSKYLK